MSSDPVEEVGKIRQLTLTDSRWPPPLCILSNSFLSMKRSYHVKNLSNNFFSTKRSHHVKNVSNNFLSTKRSHQVKNLSNNFLPTKRRHCVKNLSNSFLSTRPRGQKPTCKKSANLTLLLTLHLSLKSGKIFKNYQNLSFSFFLSNLDTISLSTPSVQHCLLFQRFGLCD